MNFLKKAVAVFSALCLTATLFVGNAFADAVVIKGSVALDGELCASGNKNISVNFTMPNQTRNVYGLQLSVKLPDGFKIVGFDTQLSGAGNYSEVNKEVYNIALETGESGKPFQQQLDKVNGAYTVATLAVDYPANTPAKEYSAEVVVKELVHSEVALSQNALLKVTNTEADTVTFKVAACKHTKTTVKNAKSATCTAKGYTGDKVCSICGATVSKGKTIAAKGHKTTNKVTKATTSANGKLVAVCSTCKKTVKTTTLYKVSSFKLSTTKYTYDGKVKTPSVTVKDYKGKTLKNGKDYTASYASGRKNVGKYTVKLTLKGNYSGSKSLSFTVVPKSTKIKSVSAGKKKLTVKWSKQTSQTTGYQIQYSTSKSFSKAKTVTVTKNKTTSKTISKLKGKKTYYVRVRTYKTVGKTKYYSDWSKAVSKKTKK